MKDAALCVSLAVMVMAGSAGCFHSKGEGESTTPKPEDIDSLAARFVRDREPWVTEDKVPLVAGEVSIPALRTLRTVLVTARISPPRDWIVLASKDSTLWTVTEGDAGSFSRVVKAEDLPRNTVSDIQNIVGLYYVLLHNRTTIVESTEELVIVPESMRERILLDLNSKGVEIAKPRVGKREGEWLISVDTWRRDGLLARQAFSVSADGTVEVKPPQVLADFTSLLGQQ